MHVYVSAPSLSLLYRSFFLSSRKLSFIRLNDVRCITRYTIYLYIFYRCISLPEYGTCAKLMHTEHRTQNKQNKEGKEDERNKSESMEWRKLPKRNDNNNNNSSSSDSDSSTKKNERMNQAHEKNKIESKRKQIEFLRLEIAFAIEVVLKRSTRLYVRMSVCVHVNAVFWCSSLSQWSHPCTGYRQIVRYFVRCNNKPFRWVIVPKIEYFILTWTVHEP